MKRSLHFRTEWVSISYYFYYYYFWVRGRDTRSHQPCTNRSIKKTINLNVPPQVWSCFAHVAKVLAVNSYDSYIINDYVQQQHSAVVLNRTMVYYNRLGLRLVIFVSCSEPPTDHRVEQSGSSLRNPFYVARHTIFSEKYLYVVWGIFSETITLDGLEDRLFFYLMWFMPTHGLQKGYHTVYRHRLIWYR